MTIPSTQRKAGPYYGTGAQTSWPFTFKVFAATDVKVTVINSGGVETDLVLDSDYSVTLNDNQDTSPGGAVVYPLAGSPLAVSSRLTILGDLDYDQPMDVPSGGNFAPEALENELDRIVMQMQQLLERLGRTITISVGTPSGVSTQLPVPNPVNVIGWDQNGTGLTNYSLTDLVVSSAFSDWIFDTFTGTGSETTFGLQRSPGTVGNTDVSVDGITLVPNTDFFISGNALTFTTPPSLGARILVRYGSAAPQAPQVGAYLQTENQVATAGQTAFTLTNSYTPGNGSLSVYVNGVRMTASYDYTENNSTLVTFTSGLTAGDRVLFVTGMEVTTGAEGPPGSDGRGIVSFVRTSGTGAPGTTDTYTITYTDATTTVFSIYNGANGTGTGDMAKATYDTNNSGVVDAAESVAWSGVTGKANATTSVDGLMSATDKTKLNGIASGATANSADATLLARANHTGTQAISTVTNLQTTLDGKAPINVPQVSQSTAYTCVLTDKGKHLLHPSADTTARTFTIPANSSVAFDIGDALTFINQNGAGVITIAINTDTMRLAGAGTTGSRTLAANGIATAIKVTTTEWLISGVGLT